MFGALASVAGGAGTHVEWAWLTGSRLAQYGMTPLYWAASSCTDAAIRALVEAKADVNANDDVRVGDGGGGRLEGRGEGAEWGLHCTILLWEFEPEVVERSHEN
jgi:hypothetical protein